MKVSDIFEGKMEIDFGKFKNELKNKVGKLWIAFEEEFLPFSFLSEKGTFLFKLLEDDESLIDTWCLVISKNKNFLKKFVEGKITYKDFFERAENDFYLVEWNINSGQLKIKRKIRLQDVLDLTKYIHDEKVYFRYYIVYHTLLQYKTSKYKRTGKNNKATLKFNIKRRAKNISFSK